MLRIAVLVSVIVGVPHFPSAAAGRFSDIAQASGIPYRDFPVEYPIGQLALIELVGSWGPVTARILLALVAFLADVTAFGAILVGWGRLAASRYLMLGTPLLIFIYRRIDLVAVAFVALGLAQAKRKSDRSSGTWLGAGVLIRLWPAVLLPALAVERRARAILSFAVVTLTGIAIWLLIGGAGGLRQVGSFRGASGWELESTVGAIVWAFTGEYRFEQGANRTGVVSEWARVLLLALLLLGLACIWLRARRGGHDLAGAPALAATAWLMALSPLLSPQFVSWLLPMGAIAGLDDRRWHWLAALPVVITGGIVTIWYLDIALGPGWNQVLLSLRNATLVAIPVVWLVSGGQTRPVAYADTHGRHG